MAIKLTKSQLELAKWLGQQHNSGSLPEQFSVKWNLKDFMPETGNIVNFEGDQPEINFAAMVALENAELIITVNKKIKPAKKSGAKKGSYYQFGWPRHETMRVYALLGNIFDLGTTDTQLSEHLPLDEVTEKPKDFISQRNIEQLKEISNENYDVSRLIKYCEEINDNFIGENYSSVVFLSRAILDHCPPIFGQRNFDSVVAQCGGSSFKSVLGRLNTSLKKIADHHIHKHISKKESLPVEEEIDFSTDLNFLLGRIIENLHE